MTPFLYISMIFLWGLTWIAIRTQVSMVPVETSIVYRFVVAFLILLVIMIVRRDRFVFSLKQHAAMFLLGLFFFSFNFLFVYKAAPFLSSGLLAILFSCSVIMIMLNQWLFFNVKLSMPRVFGALVGLSGLCCLFLPELYDFEFSRDAWFGIGLALSGTYCFSWGNTVATYCNRLSIPNISSTFYGMVYGVVILGSYCLWAGISFQVPLNTGFVASLLYLAIPGSVIGFLAYRTLITRVGAERAAYITLLSPLVAMMTSVYFESFVFTKIHFIGVALVLTGNALVLAKPKRLWPKKARQLA